MGGVLAEFCIRTEAYQWSSEQGSKCTSRRVLLLQESTIQVLGFQHLEDLCQTDADFKEAYEAC